MCSPENEQILLVRRTYSNRMLKDCFCDELFLFFTAVDCFIGKG